MNSCCRIMIDGISFESRMTEMSQALYGNMEEPDKLQKVIWENLRQLGYGD